MTRTLIQETRGAGRASQLGCAQGHYVAEDPVSGLTLAWDGWRLAAPSPSSTPSFPLRPSFLSASCRPAGWAAGLALAEMFSSSMSSLPLRSG